MLKRLFSLQRRPKLKDLHPHAHGDSRGLARADGAPGQEAGLGPSQAHRRWPEWDHQTPLTETVHPPRTWKCSLDLEQAANLPHSSWRWCWVKTPSSQMWSPDNHTNTKWLQHQFWLPCDVITISISSLITVIYNLKIKMSKYLFSESKYNQKKRLVVVNH